MAFKPVGSLNWGSPNHEFFRTGKVVVVSSFSITSLDRRTNVKNPVPINNRKNPRPLVKTGANLLPREKRAKGRNKNPMELRIKKIKSQPAMTDIKFAYSKTKQLGEPLLITQKFFSATRYLPVEVQSRTWTRGGSRKNRAARSAETSDVRKTTSVNCLGFNPRWGTLNIAGFEGAIEKMGGREWWREKGEGLRTSTGGLRSNGLG